MTHGNAPQVGFILRRSEIASSELHEIPLDVCDADAQGAIGYALQQNLCNVFGRRDDPRTVITLITQVEVAADDPAFSHPTKAIGGFLSQEEAIGWEVIEEIGRGWRRVVAAPDPHRMIELPAIERLLASGFVTIAAGGGGIPVIVDDQGELHGVAAVIDKDLTASLLATRLKADVLVIGTLVERVALNWGKPDQHWVDEMKLDEAKQRLANNEFEASSMQPKIEAIVRYLENGGPRAIVTDLASVERALDGQAGTTFVP